MKKQLPIILIIVLFFSCSQPSILTEKGKVLIIEDIRATFNDYHSDIRKSGLTAEFKYLDDSPGFFWVPPGYTHSINYDSVVKVLKQTDPMYRSINNSFSTLKIIPLSRDFASYTGQLNSIITDTSGKIFNYSLVETGVLIKRSKGWKLLNGQTAVINR